VDDLAGGSQRLAGADFGKDVIDFGESQPGVKFLAAFAVHVELFGEEADAFALGFGGVGKWEGLEAARLVVAGPVFESASSRKCPCHVDMARQNAKDKSIT